MFQSAQGTQQETNLPFFRKIDFFVQGIKWSISSESCNLRIAALILPKLLTANGLTWWNHACLEAIIDRLNESPSESLPHIENIISTMGEKIQAWIAIHYPNGHPINELPLVLPRVYIGMPAIMQHNLTMRISNLLVTPAPLPEYHAACVVQTHPIIPPMMLRLQHDTHPFSSDLQRAIGSLYQQADAPEQQRSSALSL